MYAEKKKIRHCFNRSAHRYDEAARVQQFVADCLLNNVAQIDPKPCKILDLGSGTGYCISPLKAGFPKAALFGLDFAYSMCRRAQEKNAHSVICADFDFLPFPSACFDLIFSNLALQWSLHLSATLREISRTLTSGGHLVFSTLSAGSLWELEEAWHAVDHNRHINPFLTLAEIKSHLHENGFSILNSNTESKSFYYQTVLEVLMSLKSVGANHVIEQQKSMLHLKSLLARLEQNYPRPNAKSPFSLTYETVYITARKTP